MRLDGLLLSKIDATVPEVRLGEHRSPSNPTLQTISCTRTDVAGWVHSGEIAFVADCLPAQHEGVWLVRLPSCKRFDKILPHYSSPRALSMSVLAANERHATKLGLVMTSDGVSRFATHVTQGGEVLALGQRCGAASAPENKERRGA